MPDSDNVKAIKAAMPKTLESEDCRGPIVYDTAHIASLNGIDPNYNKQEDAGTPDEE